VTRAGVVLGERPNVGVQASVKAGDYNSVAVVGNANPGGVKPAQLAKLALPRALAVESSLKMSLKGIADVGVTVTATGGGSLKGAAGTPKGRSVAATLS
jgi:hypothetical protein